MFPFKNTADTLLCFQTKENRLTFPTREKAMLKCEDINVKYYSHLPTVKPDLFCTSPNHQLCNLKISTNSLNEKQKLHHYLDNNGRTGVWDSPVRGPLAVL